MVAKNQMEIECAWCGKKMWMRTSHTRLYRHCSRKCRDDFDRRWMPEPNSGCWLWVGAVDGKGYAVIGVDGQSMPAHRHSYERKKGPIPEGLVIDHLCRVPSCVNPDHLEPVTNRENLDRGPRLIAIRTSPTCRRGHEWSPENTYRSPAPPHYRSCRACTAIAIEKYQRKKALYG
jgi:endogenous inhibitor of DNA gyrase (YacG/DUF329 family)